MHIVDDTVDEYAYDRPGAHWGDYEPVGHEHDQLMGDPIAACPEGQIGIPPACYPIPTGAQANLPLMIPDSIPTAPPSADLLAQAAQQWQAVQGKTPGGTVAADEPANKGMPSWLLPLSIGAVALGVLVIVMRK